MRAIQRVPALETVPISVPQKNDSPASSSRRQHPVVVNGGQLHQNQRPVIVVDHSHAPPQPARASPVVTADDQNLQQQRDSQELKRREREWNEAMEAKRTKVQSEIAEIEAEKERLERE